MTMGGCIRLLPIVLFVAQYCHCSFASTTTIPTATTMDLPRRGSLRYRHQQHQEQQQGQQEQIEYSSFPSVHVLTLPKSDLIHNTFLRERIAQIDLLQVQCWDNTNNNSSIVEQCRLKTLIHTEQEFQRFHNLGMQQDTEATKALLHNRRLVQQQQKKQQQLQLHRKVWSSSENQSLVPSIGPYEIINTTTTNGTQQRTTPYPRISEFPCMLSYEGTMQWIQDLIDQQQHNDTSSTIRPGVQLTWSDIGDSYLKTQDPTAGHDIRVLRVSSTTSATTTKAPLMILSGIHPREYAPPELVRQWIHWLVTTKTDVKAQLALETTDVYWIPYVNPDGRVVAEGSDLYRRKNMNANNGGSTLYCSEFEVGVDLNRNFPFRYGRDDGSSSNPCDETYRGSGPASEPEVQAVIRLGESIFPKSQQLMTYVDPNYFEQDQPLAYDETTTQGVFLDVHSYGNSYIYASTIASQMQMQLQLQ
jgi:murein tripeptide amidase MpaA